MENLPALTLGLEEELFLVHQTSGELCKKWPSELWEACQSHYEGQIIHEFLNAQAEIISKVHQNVESLHEELLAMRQFLTEQAAHHGLAPMACSTHPKANWHEQTHTASSRYHRLAKELQIVADRMVVCGMHVHVGIESKSQKLKFFNELQYYLPLILSLTTSSPFWSGEDTGLMSYRATVLHGLPRAGMPPVFHSESDYEAFMSHLVDSGAIESGKELWWDLRISSRFPTVEARVADTCTNQRDALAIAALIQCLARHILSEAPSPQSLLEIKKHCASENRWRAQRHGVNEAKLLIAESPKLVSVKELLPELVDVLRVHGKALGCEHYLEDTLKILEEGTSAQKQRALFNKSLEQGLSRHKAIEKVIQFLIEETRVETPVIA